MAIEVLATDWQQRVEVVQAYQRYLDTMNQLTTG